MRSQTTHVETDFPHLLANSCLLPSDDPFDIGKLRKGLLEYVFEVASREDSRDSNRKRMYTICNVNADEDDDS